MAGIDFFDVDHTITRASSGTRFVSLAMRKGIVPRRLVFVLPYYSLTYKLGVFRLKDYAQGFPYMRGIPRESLERIARESFDDRLREDVYDGAIAEIAKRRDAGSSVVLATSSLDFIVAPLADFLGIDSVLATTLEFRQGVCTGRISGVPMFRREKSRRVMEFIRDRGEKPENCSFYSDSIYDLPLLEAVGRPVAVNPDFRLRRIARRRAWTVMDLD